ncbi:hypothetical protein [Actinomadura alba]|uniref:DUF1963 domain-containing protein n=1 Tax=Actinomadura alba TaxID=406431 RepID=A0ABR7M2D5_9ACTN|nr:hypothetical protein [Actinomadura alba]MBC6470743.1 hypothetical protein [Actinomadura alba]
MSQPAPLEFVSADGPVREPVTKIGGQPVWLEEPQWPLSRETGEPMRFLGQFALDGGRLAFLFMSGGGDDYIDGTWEPKGGENALVIQPGGRIPGFVTMRAQAEGPTAGTDHLPHTREPEGKDGAWQFLGGPGVEPNWLLGEEQPGTPRGWRLVVQLTDGAPFFFNFGDGGIGYAFVSPDGKEGRFLWQCS